MSLPACLLIETLLAPERAQALTMAEWETLIGQARASQLLIRLATLKYLRERREVESCRQAGLLQSPESVPD